MDLSRLESIRRETGIDRLKIMCTGEMEVDWRGLKELQIMEDGRSLKQTDDGAIFRLAESLLRFGIVNNLQIWSDGDGEIYCFDAHHRRKALAVLEKIGLDIPMLPATRCLAEDRVAARKLLLVKESRSSWINAKVVPDYTKSVGLSFEIASAVIDLPEFEWRDIAKEYAEERKKAEKADIIPEVEEDDRIQAGDLIELGGHRVLCGDSTRAEDVERLMGGEKIDLIFTDPPYGVSYADKNEFLNAQDEGNRIQRDIKNDHMSLEETGELWARTFDVWSRFHAEYSSFYIFAPGPVYLFFMMMMMMNKNDHPLKIVIIWSKNNHVLGRSDYNYKHESILYGWRYKHVFYGKGKQKSSVWEYNKPLKNDLHPTMKPVELMENAILNSSLPGMITADYFLGSGSTLIACEKTGRLCFGMEIDPHYCAVVVQRWADFTGNDIVKINGEEILWSEYGR